MEDNKKNGVVQGEFVSRPRASRKIALEQQFEREAQKKKSGQWNNAWHAAGEKSGRIPESYRKLLRNTAICAVLALSIWGIKSIDSTVTNQISDGIESVVSEDMRQDEDMGRLKFVSAEADQETIDVNAPVYSLPLEGEVVETFSDSGKDVKIKSEERSKVNAILSGKVVETGEDQVIIQNDNGTRTTYLGVVPGVKAGDTVQNSDTIGQLMGEVLCLETVGGIGYVDSLNMQELTSMGG